MSDVRQWLENLGLSQYADAFEENGVNTNLLPEITNDDLKDLGVVRLADRKAILKAIMALDAFGMEDESELVTPSRAEPELDVPRDVERRQITVMFCDMVGSTALSKTLDPEDLRAVMVSYQRACGAVVERYEGHVAQYLGDGLMTYFGWPKAHEDDAQRAVWAGLDIVEAVKVIDTPALLSVRVGISTGPVVVGETGEGDASVPKTAVGETPNLAARIQGKAEPNTVAITETTRHLLGSVFELENLGPQNLKGIEDAVVAYRVLGASAAESRFEAAQIANLTPLVGREHEIGLLLERWQQAKDGEGQAVMLSGEPGIGKSRIVQTIGERIGDQPHIRLRYQCSPYHTNSAFHPIVEQLARAARFNRDDGADAKLVKLETLLSQSAKDVAKVAPLFAALLSLPVDRYSPLNLSPQQQKENTVATLADQTVALSLRTPVLMIFEDAHWIDPSTLEVLDRVVDRIQDAAVLLMLTYRPEFEPPWTGQGHVTLHSLNRLGRRHGADMVAKMTGGRALSDAVRKEIVAKTDGVPLFVEELTKAVLEARDSNEPGDLNIVDEPLPPLTIPSTLQDSLMARLDRLASVKDVAQTGACIGREFSYELLRAVTLVPDEELQNALQQLVKAELISRRGVPPDVTYIFKHALVQDAAESSLLNSARRSLHVRIAETLENKFESLTHDQPEVLARHFEHGEDHERALHYLLEAGERSVRVHANHEALRFFSDGLSMLDKLADTADRREQRIQLNLQLGSLHTLIGHYAQSLDVYRHMLPEAEATDNERLVAHLEARLGRAHYMLGDHEPALIHLKRGILLAERIGDSKRIANVCQNVGDVYFSSGSLPLAIESYRKSLEIAETSNDALGTAAACTMLSNVHCRAGDLQDALAWGKRALSAGEKMDDERRIAWANIMLAQTHFWRGDAKSLLPHLDRANHSFDKIGDFRGSAWINIMRSFHAFLLSDYEQSMEYSRQAVAMAKSSGGFQHELSAQLRVIAESLLKLERYRDAYDLCRQCLDIAEPSGNKLEYGYAFALLAEIYATDEFDDLDEAENYFEKSLMTLGDVGAKLDVARAYAAGARVSLARGDGRARELAEAARKLCLEFEGNLYLRYVEELSSMAQSSG